MNARPRVWAAAAAALCAAAIISPLRAAHAQAAASGPAAPATAAVVTPAVDQAPASVATGPTLASASVAVRAVDQQRAASSAPTNAMPARNSQGQPKALMIVGGAAFIAGALIGDTAGTAIMIGGAGIGLYGLYLYLQ